MKKYLALILGAVLVMALTACNVKKMGELSYYSYDGSSDKINKDLFYVNNNIEWGADPALIYIDHGEYEGYFFCYNTSGEIGTNGIIAWCSKNLTDWQNLGPVFMPDQDTYYSYKGYWAPAIIYDADWDKYLLFFSAPWGSDGGIRYDTFVVSDSPAGPFVPFESENVAKNEPVFQFELHRDEIPEQYRTNFCGHYPDKPGYMKAIGPQPFVDPETNKKYFFFVWDLGTDGTTNDTSGDFVMEMEDWDKPKYETLTRVTEFGKESPGSSVNVSEGGKTNEGPMCYYKDGKYYLIFLSYTYYTPQYQTRMAVSDNVMGPYKKLQLDEGAQVIYTDGKMQRQAVGIHGLCNVGDKLYCAYMTFANNENYDDKRKFAIDEIAFCEREDGVITLQCNGPSVSPQPLPKEISGYENMAKYATIEADNMNSRSNTKYLVDGVIPYHKNSVVPQFETTPGDVTLTFTFEEYVTLRAVMVYNANNYNDSFDKVKSITFDYKKNGVEGSTTIKNIIYNWDLYNEDDLKWPTGSAAIAEFDELDVKKVTIVVEDPGTANGVRIPEVVLLGKESDGSTQGVGNNSGSLFEKYNMKYTEPSLYNYDYIESEIKVDGVKDSEYGPSIFKYYALNKETTGISAEAFAARKEDGLYIFIDVTDPTLVGKEDKYKHVEMSLPNNSYVALYVACKKSVDKYTVGYKIDLTNGMLKYVGIKSAGKYLRSWAPGYAVTKLKDGSLDNLSQSTGYYAEFFIPWETLGVTDYLTAQPKIIVQLNHVENNNPTLYSLGPCTLERLNSYVEVKFE